MADIFRNSSSRRAAKACLRCRWRRVRCDVTRTELPCTNCRRDEKDCVVVSRSRMRQGPMVEDVRTVNKTDHETELAGRYFGYPSEKQVATREGRTSATPDAEEAEKTNARRDAEDASVHTLEPRPYTINEESRDPSTQAHDAASTDDFADPPWTGVTTADAKQGDVPPLDSIEYNEPTTPDFEDILGNQPLEHDPMLFTTEDGERYGPLGEGSWDGLPSVDESHQVVVQAIFSASSQLAEDHGSQPGLQMGPLPNIENLQSYIRHYDNPAKSIPSHCAMSGPMDLTRQHTVSGWIQNDRSLYFLHEMGVL